MMRITQHLQTARTDYLTHKLSQRMLNPICGLTQEIGFIKRSRFGANILTAGVDIAGVHHLLNQPNPGRGAYHIGGAGIFLNEPLIKSLGETIERYAQLITELTNSHELLFLSYEAMHRNYLNVLEKEYLDLYNEDQLARKNFPFNAFDESLPLSWIKVRSIHTEKFFYIPAQYLFVGYHIKKHLQEPWYSTAVTTGTAAHTELEAALLGAILEIIQIDSTIGHWYGNHEIPQIIFDKRTKPMENLLKKYGNLSHNPVRFFWLKNPDLAGFSIACVLDKPEKCIPRVSIGLGASTSLNEALYKAYLEAIGVANLSNILILKETLYENQLASSAVNAIYDIDQNVAQYGKGHHYENIQRKFNSAHCILASEIPPDISGTKVEQLQHLVKSFINSGKELLFVDLTNEEAKALGFYVPRLWSKDTLSLCFPSAAPAKHPRFKHYGGFSHDVPHPYP